MQKRRGQAGAYVIFFLACVLGQTMTAGGVMKNIYDREFYRTMHQQSVYAARTVLAEIFSVCPEIRSVVDLGCGTATWLAVLRESGIRDIQGLDGPWVKEEFLHIPLENFRPVDLENPIDLGRKYDLAISLEVAEHLSPDAAGTFVASLAGLADIVLFSAAIPHQGGRNHINEQWPEYWEQLFQHNEFVAVDFIRARIWNDDEIPNCYRQNILMFVKQNKIGELQLSPPPGGGGCFPLCTQSTIYQP